MSAKDDTTQILAMTQSGVAPSDDIELTALLPTIKAFRAKQCSLEDVAKLATHIVLDKQRAGDKDQTRNLQEELRAARAAGELSPAEFEHLQSTILRTAPNAQAATQLVQADAERRVAATVPRTGAVIKDRYQLLDVIGEGGMGVVYRAKDLLQEELQDRSPFLALKVLSSQFAQDSRMRIALQREARKAQTLAHPNVITVYNFDREQDTVFLTMELLEGESLQELVKKSPQGLPRDQALDIIRGMSLGLAYAHNKGIVHSDFKAGNVFYTNREETKILDFGIARAVPRAGYNQGAQYTTFDVASLGGLTPAYASPEMLEGNEPTTQDDVFALGIVCYQLLTGRHPFSYRPADEARQVDKPPKQPKLLSKREWRALSSALAFDGQRRPQNAAAFLRQLEGRSTPKKLALGALVGLAITSAYVVYDGATEVLDARPDVAFEQLTEQQRGQFAEYMSEAATLLQYQDYDTAMQLYVKAYRMHPRNQQVVRALDQLIGLISDQASRMTDARDLQVIRQNLERLAAIDDFLARRPALTDALSKLP